MISEQVKQKYGQTIHGVLHMPMNVCSHCMEEDDPESASHWPEDEDGDRICYPCFEKTNGGGMKADWDTLMREGQIASESAILVGQEWVRSECGSELESLLESVKGYLFDRGQIAFEFSLIPIRSKAKQAA
jgi:hypothetical protein